MIQRSRRGFCRDTFFLCLLGAVAATFLTVAIVNLWASLGEEKQFIEPYHELSTILKQVQAKANAEVSEPDWQTFGEQIERPLNSIRERLRTMQSQHPARAKLMACITSLMLVLRRSPTKAQLRLKSAERVLFSVAMELKVPSEQDAQDLNHSTK